MIPPYFEPVKRRDRHRIIADILNVAKAGKLKTQIMYNANLSFAQTEEYLSFLLERNLLELMSEHHNPKNRNVYKTTSKGVDYLNVYKDLTNALKI